MKVDTVAPAPGAGAAPPAVRRLTVIDQRTGLYEDRAFLRLAVPGGAEQLAFPNGGTRLTLRLEPLTWDARAPGPLAATLTDLAGGGVRVALARPTHLHGIHLNSARGTGFADRIAIHRTDGNAVADEASTHATPRVFGSVSSVEDARRSGTIRARAPAALQMGSPRALVPAGSGTTAASSGVAASMSASGDVSTSTARAPSMMLMQSGNYACDFTDRVFVLYLTAADGSVRTDFSSAWISALMVTGYPSAPSVSIALPAGASGAADDEGDAAELGEGTATLLWATGGELGRSPDAPLPSTLDLGEPLRQALADSVKRYLEGLDEAPPAHVDVALCFRSSAPCRFAVDSFEVQFEGMLTVLPDGTAPKQVVRFPGQALRRVCFALPPAVGAGRLAFVVDEALERHATAAGAALGRVEVTPGTSLTLAAGERVEAPVHLEAAARLIAILLALSPLTTTAAFAVRLRRDAGGRPGEVVWQRAARVPAARSNAWRRYAGPASVLLASGTWWLEVAVNEGCLDLALTAAEAGSTLPPVKRIGGDGRERDIAGFVLQHALELEAGHAAEVGSGDDAPFTVRVGDEALAAAAGDGDRRYRYEFVLDAASLSASGIEVCFESSSAGTLTVYPADYRFG